MNFYWGSRTEVLIWLKLLQFSRKQNIYAMTEGNTHPSDLLDEGDDPFSTLAFRNRIFLLRNVHDKDQPTPAEVTNRSTMVLARQAGVDGIHNELPRERYNVRHLNLSRYLDEAAIDACIQSQISGEYYTSQEPMIGNQTPQTDTCDITFQRTTAPSF
ncbi:hypothetical protein PHMEG_00023088 [Phytophthora megakarya]|uniref:Uncharacterized protein n=1 Tax=Phytophthora megakarya TaxID=4795 RepID=A0A225VHQ1_9STRA|nr:hypothetical protein PHMEG_00023088 [Phytophthora megakarya]